MIDTWQTVDILPASDGWYLVTVDYGQRRRVYEVVYYGATEQKWFFREGVHASEGSKVEGRVVAWSPMPSPWAGKE
jgi:hypothetical protein